MVDFMHLKGILLSFCCSFGLSCILLVLIEVDNDNKSMINMDINFSHSYRHINLILRDFTVLHYGYDILKHNSIFLPVLTVLAIIVM